MNRRIASTAAAASLVCAAGAFLPGGVASAGTTDFDDYGNACSVAGTLTSAMGVRYAPDEATYDVAGTLDCTSSKYSHGTLTGKGSGVLSCFGGFSQATYKIVWSNGETSLISTKSGDFTYGTGNYGEVTKGALQGSEVGMAWGREAAGAEYTCAAGKVHSAEFAGGIGFHNHAAHE